jgi:acyl-CoA thioesterase FadM
MHRFTFELTHRPERDGTVKTSAHAPFFLTLEWAMWAWISTLDLAGSDELTAGNFALVNLNTDYRREIFTGEADFDVTLERIGTSSIGLTVQLTQHSQLAATIKIVMAKVSRDRSESIPFTPAQRELLEKLQG